jgi:hypothetical protein
VYQDPDPGRMARAVAKLVRGEATVAEAVASLSP